jgi:uncharacterized protein (DUF2235 family)
MSSVLVEEPIPHGRSAGMLRIVGLLREDNEGLIPYSIAANVNRISLESGILSARSVGSTSLHMKVVRHAISIDERRAFFRQNLFGTPHAPQQQDIKEIWFAGVHSDVGGSYLESERQLSKISLQWMVATARRPRLARGVWLRVT